MLYAQCLPNLVNVALHQAHWMHMVTAYYSFTQSLFQISL